VRRYRDLSDRELSFLLAQFEAKVAALKLSSTAVGAAMYQQFAERLDQARAEVERRRC
jgi:hypothetical protein